MGKKLPERGTCAGDSKRIVDIDGLLGGFTDPMHMGPACVMAVASCSPTALCPNCVCVCVCIPRSAFGLEGGAQHTAPTAAIALATPSSQVVMAPRKGETDEQKIHRMYKNASEAISRAQFRQIVAALKEHPRHILALHRQLSTLGAFGDAAGAATSSATEPPAKLALCDSDAPARTDGDDEQSTDAADLAPTSSSHTGTKPAFVFDRNTTRVEHFSPTHLEVALSLLEPASLSKENLKKVVKKGCRDYNRKVLQRYWEYLTGEGPAMPLAKDGTKSWDSFIANAKVMNETRGRRLSDAVLPTDWYEQGLNSFALARDGELELKKKTADGVLSMNFPVPKGACEFNIEQNWRENGAVLTQVNGPLMQPLGILFAQASTPGASAGAAKRPAGGPPSIRITAKRPPASGPRSTGAKRGRGADSSSDVNLSIDASALQNVMDSAGLQLNFSPRFRSS